MKDIDKQIEEAIVDGLSNHTGEWFNGFIVPGLNLTEEQSKDLLFYLVKAKRLNKNIQSLINQQVKEARLDESRGYHLINTNFDNYEIYWINDGVEMTHAQRLKELEDK